jgi:hypothetical protein
MAHFVSTTPELFRSLTSSALFWAFLKWMSGATDFQYHHSQKELLVPTAMVWFHVPTAMAWFHESLAARIDKELWDLTATAWFQKELQVPTLTAWFHESLVAQIDKELWVPTAMAWFHESLAALINIELQVPAAPAWFHESLAARIDKELRDLTAMLGNETHC